MKWKGFCKEFCKILWNKNNSWNIRRLVNKTFVPSFQRTSVSYSRLRDFWWMLLGISSFIHQLLKTNPRPLKYYSSTVKLLVTSSFLPSGWMQHNFIPWKIFCQAWMNEIKLIFSSHLNKVLGNSQSILDKQNECIQKG